MLIRFIKSFFEPLPEREKAIMLSERRVFNIYKTLSPLVESIETSLDSSSTHPKYKICTGFFLLGFTNGVGEANLLTAKEDYYLWDAWSYRVAIDKDLSDKIHKHANSIHWSPMAKEKFNVMHVIKNEALEEIYKLGHNAFSEFESGNTTAFLGAVLMIEDYLENPNIPNEFHC